MEFDRRASAKSSSGLRELERLHPREWRINCEALGVFAHTMNQDTEQKGLDTVIAYEVSESGKPGLIRSE